MFGNDVNNGKARVHGYRLAYSGMATTLYTDGANEDDAHYTTFLSPLPVSAAIPA
jgi:hypothetical protein